MDTLEARLLVALQKAFPLTPTPFADIAADLGISETRCLEEVRRLKREGLIRQISAIFDSRSLGYQSVLVAAAVVPERIGSAAAAISAHPGVSHNYSRNHAFNLWFTLALEPGRDLAAEVARLAGLAGCSRWLILPALKTFKIEVALDRDADPMARGPQRQPRVRDPKGAPSWISARDKDWVRNLQEDIEVVPRPFLAAAGRMGATEEELFEWMAEAGAAGVLRRFAAILRHHRAGFSFNGMGVWKAAPAEVDNVGALFASFRSVSHCYERPVQPGWPYNLFSLVHARSRGEAEAVFRELSRVSGLDDYQVLYSDREFKKERVRYFLEDGRLRPAGAVQA